MLLTIRGRGGRRAILVRVKMPQNFENRKTITFLCQGFGDPISLCQPISSNEEAKLLGSIANELNEKCGLDLAIKFTTDGYMQDNEQSDDITETIAKRIVYNGGSHGVRTAELVNMNIFNVRDLCERGWKLFQRGGGGVDGGAS